MGKKDTMTRDSHQTFMDQFQRRTLTLGGLCRNTGSEAEQHKRAQWVERAAAAAKRRASRPRSRAHCNAERPGLLAGKEQRHGNH